jgi:DNA-binding FadR family transcriptional regulator
LASLPIETERLYQRVAQEVGELIRCGEFPIGQRLPSERDLARQLGVSRPVIREAMIALEIAGLVDVRTGSGVYVKKIAPDIGLPATISDVGPSPFDVIAARKILEPEIALVAAANVSKSDLQSIAAALKDMTAAVAEQRDLRPSDRLFHTRVAAATHNTILAGMVDQLWQYTMSAIFTGLHPRTGLPSNETAALEEHALILEALRARDGHAAATAMRTHLARVETIMLEDDTVE